MVYITSDLHIGHKNVHKYRSEKFSTAEEHHQYMIDKILSLGKRDIIKIVGDFLFDGPDLQQHVEQLSKAKCRIQLIMGNHDTLKLYNGILPNIEMLNPLYSYKGFWFSHCPIIDSEMRGRTGCIHGHLHKEKVMIDIGDTEPVVIEHPMYFNVNIDVNNYNIVTMEEIKDTFKPPEGVHVK